ncbi:MAG: mechanosensitive ion channel [Gammaproteobacteria bacterium]|jgi:small-conductance mechanosensitive channel
MNFFSHSAQNFATDTVTSGSVVNRNWWYAALLVIAFVPVPLVTAIAAEIDDLQAQLKKIDQTYKPHADSLSNDQLNEAIKQVATLKSKVDDKAKEQTAQITNLKSQLDSLGEPSESDPKEVIDKRTSLKKTLTQQESLHAQYKLLAIQIDDRLNFYQDLRQTLFKQRLLARGPAITELLRPVLSGGDNPVTLSLEFITDHHGFDVFSIYDAAALAIWLTIAAIVSFWLCKKLRTRGLADGEQPRPIDRFLQGLIVTFARYLPRLLISLMLAIFVANIGPDNQSHSLVEIFVLALPVYFGLRFIIELVLQPKKPAFRVLQLDDNVARSLSRWLRALLNGSLIVLVFIVVVDAQAPGESAALFARDLAAVILVPLGLKVLLVAARVRQLQKFNAARIAMMFLLFICLVVQLLGYRNLTIQALRIVGTLILLYVILRFFQWLGGELVNVLNDKDRSLSRAVKRTFGLRPTQEIPGLIGISFLANITLWIVFFFVALRMFGFSEDIILYIQSWFLDGFTVGSLTVNPVRILFAVVLFSVLYTASGWIKASLDKKWISRTNLEKGARETIVTIVGYAGVSVAILIALGIAGVTFTNLAIIAGALSVGIGFGLQNIVNNFVSGLILLFERPIKKGDWIIVGSTEGYVKNISIRSTQIQTFDRADVIVPNSDLISNQVTNWMLYDQSGRIRVPVGVAYGSDVEKVRSILMQVAEEHEYVIKDNPDLPIRVFFLEFGDSSLNFDLRCHVFNIDKRLTVLSDLNFMIDKRFRENNIEIPFPQRDIHIRSTVTNNPQPLDT